MRERLLEACGFNWDTISPAIFGALFQSVMNKRSAGRKGAHYTTERNILKVIEPLFLDDLRAEFDRSRRGATPAAAPSWRPFTRGSRKLRFLDPACGCGNFLVIAYRELRALETELLEELTAYRDGETPPSSTISRSASTSISSTASRSRSFRPASPRWRCG